MNRTFVLPNKNNLSVSPARAHPSDLVPPNQFRNIDLKEVPKIELNDAGSLNKTWKAVTLDNSQPKIDRHGHKPKVLPWIVPDDWIMPEYLMAAVGKSKNFMQSLHQLNASVYEAIENLRGTHINELGQILIENGFDVSQPNSGDEFGPMHDVLMWGKDEEYRPLFKFMLAQGAQPGVASEHKAGQETMHYQAAKQGRLWAVEDVILGVQGNQVDWSCWLMRGAAEGGHLKIFEFLHESNIFHARHKCSMCGLTALNAACSEGRENIAKYILEMSNGDVPHIDDEWIFTTPLLGACAHSLLEVVKLLLSHGADVTKVAGLNTTPIFQASQHGHTSVVRLLLEVPEVRESLNDRGLTGSLKETPLYVASNNEHVEVVRMLLSAGSDPNSDDDSWLGSSLHAAAIKGNMEIAQLLLDHGAKLSRQNRYGQTPREVAEEKKHYEVARILTAEELDKSQNYR